MAKIIKIKYKFFTTQVKLRILICILVISFFMNQGCEKKTTKPIDQYTEIVYTIPSTESFIQQIAKIIASAQIETNIVIINVASISVADDQLPPLVTAVSSLPEQENVKLNWTDIYPSEEQILIRFENQYAPLRRPPLRANPHKWAVLPIDHPKFTEAGQSDAIEIFQNEIIFSIDSVEGFLQQIDEIIEAAQIETNIVTINVASIGVSPSQLLPLVSAVSSIPEQDNITLNWTDIYPTEEQILIRYENHYELLRKPPLSANPHRWAVLPIDLPKFIEAGQSDAIELYQNEVIFTIDSTESFLQQIDEIITAAQIETNIVTINVASIGVSQSQLLSLVSAVSSIPEQDNITLNWTDIYPTEEKTIISYENHYEPLRKPPLRANPHRWAVLPIDMPRFIEAGQSDAIELYQNEVIFTIDSTESFLQQIDEIIETSQIETNIVTINVASIGVSPSQLLPLVSAVSSIPEQDNITLNWTDLYPTEERTIIRYENHYEPLRMPPLSANPHRWAVLPNDMPRFIAAGQSHAIEQIDFAEIIDFAIDSVPSLISQLPDIIEASQNPENLVNVNFASMSVSVEQLTQLRDAVESINATPNIILNWTNIYPTERDILLGYDEDWSRLGMPPLNALPHRWSTTATDLPRFISAGQGHAVEKEIEIFDFNIASVADFLSQFTEINSIAQDPRNTVNIYMSPLSITEADLPPLGLGVSILRTLTNVNLNWTNIYPTERDILLRYDEDWSSMGMPPLAANPHRWSATVTDLPRFISAGQGNAVEKEIEIFDFNITSVADFLSQLSEINSKAQDPRNILNINMNALSITEALLAPLVNGISPLYPLPNVNLNWTNIYPTEQGILLSYHNHWIPLGNPPLSANPHRWSVTAADLPLFQNAGQGHAVEQEIEIITFNITSAQHFIDSLQEIADAANIPFTQVVVNVIQIEINQDQLDLLTEGVANMSPEVSLHWNGISSMSERILLRFHENWLPLRNPLLLATPHRWTVPTLEIALYQAENQGNAVTSHLSSMDYHCDVHPDGALLEHITAAAIRWNKHLADASSLMHAVNWEYNVDIIGEWDFDLPGHMRAMGNMTGPLLKALHTPYVQTGGNLRANSLMIVTSFSPTNAFDPNSSACIHNGVTGNCCGYPAMPLRIDTLGDEGDTNWAFQHLQFSMGHVGTQDMTPHVQSTREDNLIFFDPGMHFPDVPDDPLRARYLLSWFMNWNTTFKFGVLNNVMVVIPMDRLTLCHPGLGQIPEDQRPGWVYGYMLDAFGHSPTDHNIQLPTFEDVKAAIANGNERD